LRRRNSHDVVILAPVRHNRVPLQAATPVDVFVIIITTSELLLTPEELLDRLAQLVTPPRIHKHRTCGVLAPNARLRRAVTASAGPAGATLQLMQQARAEMGLPSADALAPPLNKAAADEQPKTGLRLAAARCRALLLARIYECLPLK